MIRIPYKIHFAFDPALDVSVREGFRAFGKVFAGVQHSSWQSDLSGWNFRLGRFNHPFVRVVPANLRLQGMTLEADGIDPLGRVAAGDHTAQCELLYVGVQLQLVEYRLYSCADESVRAAYFSGEGSPSALFEGVNEGSYILWARAFETRQPQIFQSLSAILARPDLAGEWAALKVQVGGGSFSVPSGRCPNPGGSLYQKATASSLLTLTPTNIAGSARVAFDPLARSISASCVLHRDIKFGDDSIDVAAGSQIMGGLRASRNGPQSALWVLNSDLTTRLLATTVIFSTGECECGKADHHASDVGQSPQGTLYLLSECSLHRYAPDNASIGERLPGDPAGNGGHPGGQCLRFLSGRNHFFTELFGDPPLGLGTFLYNRLILRLDGRDRIGGGTVWNGPCCAEVFQGKLWGFRATSKPLHGNAKIFFDCLESGVWRGTGVSYDPSEAFWRQLRRRGNLLFWFGFHPGGNLETSNGDLDIPICAVADGKKIRRAEFPFFAKRVTRCEDEAGAETLLVVGNDIATGQALRNNGRALSLAELTSETPVCALWNSGSSEFRMNQSAWTAAGGDISNLPLYLKWRMETGRNGGGYWLASETIPSAPYLTLNTSGGVLIRYTLTGSLPYDPAVWGLLCFKVGTVVIGDPGSTPINAEEAFNMMPEGTKWRLLQRNVPYFGSPMSAVQVTDRSAAKELKSERDTYPTLWARIDVADGLTDLTTYTQLLKFSQLQTLAKESQSRVDLVVLVSPSQQPCVLPTLSRRLS